MKQELIKAVSNRGKEDEETVEKECDIPENLTDLLEICNGDEDQVFKYALAAYKVELQNKIRKPTARKMTYTIDSFKRLLPLVESKVLTMDQAREGSQYFGVWPLPVEGEETATEG